MNTMDNKQHDIKQARPSGVDRPIEQEEPRKPGVQDPYSRDPGSGSEDAGVDQGEETEIRKEEGLDMKAKQTFLMDDHRSTEMAEENVVINDEDILPTGIQTGQTGRGSYSTDTSTGAGRYADHRSGTFGVSPVAQPGNDEQVEPDPIDTKIQR